MPATAKLPDARQILTQPEDVTVGGQERELELQPGIAMRFCWCPPGTFLMGSPEQEAQRESRDGPQHEVTFTQGFWLAKHLVTQAQWQAVLNEGNPSQKGQGPDHPVDSVSWEDARRFCQKLHLCLPMEPQWEHACRAGSTTPFALSTGTFLNAQLANFNGGYPHGEAPHAFPWHDREEMLPVGSFPPNAWGLHDMHGQLWEWCEDSQGDYAEEAVTDPPAMDAGGRRVLRGGSWVSSGMEARSANRIGGEPSWRYTDFGFRPSSTQPGRPEALRSGPLREAKRGTSQAER